MTAASSATPPENRRSTPRAIGRRSRCGAATNSVSTRRLIKRRDRIGTTWVYSWADCDQIALIIKCVAGAGAAEAGFCIIEVSC